MEGKLYTLEQASNELGIGYKYVSSKCKKLKLKLIIGKTHTKYLNEDQMNKLRNKRLSHYHEYTESTGYKVDIIRITETYHIYPSKMNN